MLRRPRHFILACQVEHGELPAWRSRFKKRLSGSHRTWDYCVQYRETDFNFGSRLMEEEGIYYYFKHADGSHKMIVSDNALEHPALPGESKFIYEELEGGTREENRVWAWKKERARQKQAVAQK